MTEHTAMNGATEAKVDFLHDARPYRADDELSNTVVSFPAGALPGKGDTVQIDGIRNPRGSFVLVRRDSEARQSSLYAVTLILGVESLHSA